MFDILGVNETRFIAMQKQVKIPNIRFNGGALSRRVHTNDTCLTGD